MYTGDLFVGDSAFISRSETHSPRSRDRPGIFRETFPTKYKLQAPLVLLLFSSRRAMWAKSIRPFIRSFGTLDVAISRVYIWFIQLILVISRPPWLLLLYFDFNGKYTEFWTREASRILARETRLTKRTLEILRLSVICVLDIRRCK